MKVYRHIKSGDMTTLKVREEALPEVGSGQVLVRVQASSLNFRDIIIAQGLASWRTTCPCRTAQV